MIDQYMAFVSARWSFPLCLIWLDVPISSLNRSAPGVSISVIEHI